MKTKFKNSMKKIKALMQFVLIAGFALLFTLPLSAQEKSEVKLNLPDGVYQAGCSFILKDNQLYMPQDAIKTFGIAKLNEWFAEKKYKVLFAGEKVGEGFNKKIADAYKPSGINVCSNPFSTDRKKPWYLDEDKITDGALYVKDEIFRGWGSVRQQITVPDAYKDSPWKIYRSIPTEEVTVTERLAKEQLLPQLRMSKELAQSKISRDDIASAKLVTLDKVFHRNQEMYIGILYSGDGKLWNKKVVFSANDQSVKLITITFSDVISIKGMIDVDGCGEKELVVTSASEFGDKTLFFLEFYKQLSDYSWQKIFESKR